MYLESNPTLVHSYKITAFIWFPHKSEKRFSPFIWITKEKFNTIYLPKDFFPSEERAILLKKKKQKICYSTIEKLKTAKNYFSAFWKETQIWQKNIKDAIWVPSASDSESNIRYKITEISQGQGYQ